MSSLGVSYLLQRGVGDMCVIGRLRRAAPCEEAVSEMVQARYEVVVI